MPRNSLFENHTNSLERRGANDPELRERIRRGRAVQAADQAAMEYWYSQVRGEQGMGLGHRVAVSD